MVETVSVVFKHSKLALGIKPSTERKAAGPSNWIDWRIISNCCVPCMANQY